EAFTPAIDTTNETTGLPGEINIDGKQSIPARKDISGITIADQLVKAGFYWKSYQESLPPTGADLVNVSDGFFTNNTDFSQITPVLKPPLTSADLVYLYAVKHNPFAYFASVQDGTDARNSFKNIVGFGGPHGLFADLSDGKAPTLAFIAPNQCNDQHGRGNAGAFCNYDPNDDGTQAGLNPALIYQGDVTVRNLVVAIKASPAWKQGRSAIVVVWDENDYSISPTTNQVLVIVDTNYGAHGVRSNHRYTHYSLTKTLDAAFGLPCLNHACDDDVDAMSDLFAEKQ
ncbi:MAG TPA: alkaline phosphatase family protein, partial [Geobacterales bacterium]|nr:alkaline phosphatase family protein [Geobacterales bacterium]